MVNTYFSEVRKSLIFFLSVLPSQYQIQFDNTVLHFLVKLIKFDLIAGIDQFRYLGNNIFQSCVFILFSCFLSHHPKLSAFFISC